MNIPLNVCYPAEPLKFFKKKKLTAPLQGNYVVEILLNPDRTCTISEKSLEFDPKKMVDWVIPV